MVYAPEVRSALSTGIHGYIRNHGISCSDFHYIPWLLLQVKLCILSNTANIQFRGGVDRAFMLILGISFLFLIGLTFTMLYFIYQCNKRKTGSDSNWRQYKAWDYMDCNSYHFGTGHVYYGWVAWGADEKGSKDTFNIRVVARMWNFTFEYENGKKLMPYLYRFGMAVARLVALGHYSMVVHSIVSCERRLGSWPWKVRLVYSPTRRFVRFILTEYCGMNHSYMLNQVKSNERKTV